MAQQHLEAKLADIQKTKKPLVVLVKGAGKDSSMMDIILRTSGLAILRDQATLFVLSASDQATVSMPPITESLRKAALPAISTSDLPVVLVLDASGKAIAATRGLVTAGDLQQTLTQAVSNFHAQMGTSQTAPEAPSAVPSQAGQSLDAAAVRREQPSKAPPTPATTESRPAQPAQRPAAETATQSTAQPVIASQQEQTAPPIQPAIDPNQPVQLQIYLPDGQALRSRFKGSTTLLEVLQYVSQQMPEASSSSYSIVSLHLGKEFADADQQKSLAELGVPSLTSLRLRYKQNAPGSSGGTFIEQLTQLLMKLNPMNLVRWILDLLNPQTPTSKQRKDQAAATQQETQASGSTTSRQTIVSQAAKRRTALPGKVHTVHDAEDESESDDPDGNSYWNGNSTQFDGKDK